jgi:hypothetical protein
MTPDRKTDQSQKGSVTPKPTPTGTAERKPWKKRTPVEVVIDQIDRVKDDVTRKEEELKLARRQLQKLEEARKLLEST